MEFAEISLRCKNENGVYNFNSEETAAPLRLDFRLEKRCKFPSLLRAWYRFDWRHGHVTNAESATNSGCEVPTVIQSDVKWPSPWIEAAIGCWRASTTLKSWQVHMISRLSNGRGILKVKKPMCKWSENCGQDQELSGYWCTICRTSSGSRHWAWSGLRIWRRFSWWLVQAGVKRSSTRLESQKREETLAAGDNAESKHPSAEHTTQFRSVIRRATSLPQGRQDIAEAAWSFGAEHE